jgi:uncharacterized membrane protein YhaH (DUF805 family)
MRDALRRSLSLYFTLKGRSRRLEYGVFLLFSFAVGFIGGIVDALLASVAGFSFVNVVLSLLLFIPSITVSVRRLHDINLSGWWILSPIVIFAVTALFLYLMQPQNLFSIIVGFGFCMLFNIAFTLFLIFKDGVPEENKWGEPLK